VSAADAARWDVSERAAALHGEAMVCDLVVNWEEDFDEATRGAVLPRYSASGVNFISLTLADDFTWIEATVRHVAAERNRFLGQPDKYVLVESAADITRAKAEGKLAVGFNFQGTNGLGGDANLVATYYRLGVRQMILVYNIRNLAADGCHEAADGGLSQFGTDIVKEMNRVGMLIDCSHTGYRATMQTMEITEAPVIFSHSNAHALRQHGRNIKDDQIKACAATGGLVGITGVGDFLGEDDASLEAFMRHLDYVVTLAGPEHVGLGLDLVYDMAGWHSFFHANKDRYWRDYGDTPPSEFFPPETLPALTEAMLEAGYSDDDVRGILGGNYLRIVDEVWK
jgi:membrane dipeptidase